MAIAVGSFKNLVAKKQSALGTKASASGAQMYRRVTSTINMEKETYKSAELRPSMQRADFRHGLRSISGSISGELSVGTYQAFMESVLRAAASTAATSGSLVNLVTAAVTTGASGTFTRTTGSYLTDGFKIGMVVRWTGWTTTGAANNSHNFLITALTATVMTGTMLDGVPIGAKSNTDTVVCTEPGKHMSIPLTGHTRDYWTIEHAFTDITQSEQFKDCVFGSMNIKLPATGMATIEFPVLGLGMDTSTAAYFTSPTAVTTGKALAAVNGAVYVAGTAVAYITGMDISINGNATSAGAVVGSNQAPDITQGGVDVTGSMTVLFQDAVMRDYFVAETEISVIAVFTADNTAAASFQSFVMPIVKIGGAGKDDGEKGLVMTMPFTAVENTAGGTGVSSLATTITIYDSAAV